MRCFAKVLTLSWCAFFASLLGAPTAIAADTKPDASAQETATERYGDLPLSFEANQGQTDGHVRFLSRGSGYSFFLTESGAVLSFAGDAHSESVLRMELAGANSTARIEGLDELPGKSNYFAGSDSSRWHARVPTYSRVKYNDIYPGISLIYYGNQHQLEYDFVVAPGADPRQIHLSVAGAQKLAVDAQGNLLLRNSAGEVQLLAPKAYQQINGQKKEISGQWTLAANSTASFHLGKYDRTRPLVIDPVLMYSSFLGGGQKNVLSKITIDDAGNAYVAGYTASGDFPAAPTPLATTFGAGSQSRGAFVAKIDSTGSNLLYSTYLSGSSDEEATGLAVDKSGNVYVAGNTHSTDFPTRNALQSKCATINQAGTCSSAFLTKISPTGDSILFSTYLGGSGGESARGLVVDAKGSAYLAGITSSSDFPVTSGVAQAKCGGTCQQNAFVAKFSPAGDKLVYATYVGGGATDDAADLALDSSGNAYLAGHTTSPDFPLATPYQKSCVTDATSTSKACMATAFVTKITADGSTFAYSTYLGGSLGTKATAIAIDAQGSAYVTGSTQSPDFPVVKALQKSCGLDAASGKCSVDAFLTKFAPSGKSLVYSTYLGGTGRDEASGIAVDSAGNAHLVGRTESPDFPTDKPLQALLRGLSDAFAARFNPAGTALTFSTYHGGAASESGNGLALDAKGNLYLAGETTSADFPTQHPFQSSCAGSCTSAFVSKMALPPPAPTPAWTITKSHTDPFVEGDTGSTYTISVQNSGTGPTDGTVVTVVDTIPAGLTATNLAGTGWTCVTATATCTRTDVLAAAASYPDITLTVTVAKTAAASVTNSVQVSGGGAASAANTTDVTNVIFPLGITKTDSGNFIQGRTGVTYTIAGMKNNGNTATTGTVTVVDTLPAGISATAMSGTGWACVLATTTCTRGNALAAGASYPSITLTVDVANNAAASVINSVTISEAGFTLTTTATDTTTVLPIPVLSISKTHSAPFSQGGTGVWTIKVGNSAAATSLTYGTLTVTDTLPSGAGYTYTLASGTGTNWNCMTAGTTTITVTCADSTDAVSGGSSFPDLLLTVNVPAASPSTVSNTATASGGGATASKSSTDANVPVTQVPASLTKGTGDNQSVPVNNNYAAYSVTVKDAANLPIQNVQVTFTAGSGPSNATCFFAGSSTTMVLSDASGVATTVTPCKANAVAAGYNVQATVTTAGVNKPNFANNNTDFSLAIAPGSADVAPGAAPAGITIKASPVNGYAPTSLTVTSCLPIAGPAPQPSCSITSPITVGTAAAVNFSTTGSPAGTYTLQATIHDSSLVPVTHTSNFTLHIVTVAVVPKPAAAIEVGQSTTFTGTVTGLADTSVNWSLSCSGSCGTVNPLSTPDGATPTTYSSPTTPTANLPTELLPTVTLTGTANGDANFSDSAGPFQVTDFAVVIVPPATPVLAIPQSVTGMSQASAFPINGYSASTIPTALCGVIPAVTGGPTCSTGALNVAATNPTLTAISIPTGSASASAPVGLYTATVTGKDAVGVVHTASQMFSVQCLLSLQQTTPTLTSVQSTPNTVTYQVAIGVTQTVGGSACPYGNYLNQPVVGGIAVQDASVTNTSATNPAVTSIVSAQVNGTLSAANPTNPLTFNVGSPATGTGATGSTGQVIVPYFDATASNNNATPSMSVGLEAALQSQLAQDGTLINISATQAASGTLNVFNDPVAGACLAVNINGELDTTNNNFGISCTASVTGSQIQLTLHVAAESAAARSLHPRGETALLYAFALGLPGMVFFSVGASAFGPRRRKQGFRRIASILAIVLVLSLLVLLPACGGGFKFKFTNAATFTLTGMAFVTNAGNVVGVDVFTVPLTAN
jgi:uncharacterized repeat protein (TIGR01451 family)